MKIPTVIVYLLSAMLFLVPTMASAQRGKGKAKPKPKAQKVDTEASIKALLGEYAMGMTRAQVTAKLTEEIKKHYTGLMDQERSPTAKDEVRRRQNLAISRIKQNTVVFVGKNTPWNTSIIDDQFAHKNNESMIARLDSDQQKFFFFYNDRLYKVFIALPAEQYQGYTFPKFQQIVEQIYGKAQEEFEIGITGDSELHHLLWKSSGSLHLWAMDKTGVYGNFVLIVIDNPTHESVVSSRKQRGINVAGYLELGINPIVKTVTEKPEQPAPPPAPKKGK